MSAQEQQLAAMTQKVNDVGTELDTVHGELQAELDSLQSQINEGVNPKALDLSGLEAAIEAVKPHADALKGLSPSNVPPAGPAASSAAQEAAPTKADGTAQENTTDPAAAQAQSSSADKPA